MPYRRKDVVISFISPSTPQVDLRVNCGLVVAMCCDCNTKLMVATQIGMNLKKALEDRGLTQVWLVEKLSVSPNAVSKWVRTGGISRENAVRVAKLLDMPLDQLLMGAEPGEDALSANERTLVTMYRTVLDEVKQEVWTRLEQEYIKAKQYEKKILNSSRTKQGVRAVISAQKAPLTRTKVKTPKRSA